MDFKKLRAQLGHFWLVGLARNKAYLVQLKTRKGLDIGHPVLSSGTLHLFDISNQLREVTWDLFYRQRLIPALEERDWKISDNNKN